jgi:hypothetical protein
MIGGASGDHGRQEKGKPVVLVLSEAVLVLSEAVIDSGTCARWFYHEGHRGHEEEGEGLLANSIRRR